MAKKTVHIVDLQTANNVTGEEYLVLQDASGITYTQVTDTEAPSFEAGKYFQAQSDGTYIALETCPDNWQTMYNQCYTRTIPDTQKVPVKLITEQVELERLKYYGDKDIVPSDASYFTVNSTKETITGLTDTGKTQTELVIPYEIDGVEITTLSGNNSSSILDGNSVITKVVIPNSVTSIGEYAFRGCSSLTSINIPNSVTSIRSSTFRGCSSLTSINIPNSVTYIDMSAFFNCTALKSIKIPNSVTSIEFSAFYGCTELTKIEIPNSVTSIGTGTFAACPNLTIYCEQGSYAETYANTNGFPVVYTDVKDIATETELKSLKYYGDKDIIPSDDSYFTVDSTGETITGLTDTGKTQTELVIPYKINGKEITTLYSGVDSGTPQSILYGSSTITKITIPKSVTTLGRGAFYICPSLTSINIPDSVTSIGYSAFQGCSGLLSIEIPNSVTSIGNSAFQYCASLTSISIPNSVTSIDEYAFYGCSSLTSIDIPNSVTSIGQRAFDRCTSLTSINIPNSVTSIGQGAFNNCTSLTSVSIPNSVTSIGLAAFYGCSSLTSIDIPNSVTSIGRYAFRDCTSLTSVSIPNSVTSIDEYAFHVYNAESGSFAPISGLTIYCEQGSYAETYAKTNNIPVVYTDISATDFNNKVDKATTLEGYGITDAIGKSGTGTNAEIFNDYTNNAARGDYSHAEGSYSTAGIRGFSVTASNEAAKTYTLSKVTGLAVGDKVSLVSGSGATPSRYQYKNFGTITAIDSANNIITVDTFQSYLDKGYVYVANKPNIGDASIGSYSHAEGISAANGMASHAEGYDTHANGDYSHAEGNSTADGVASHAEGTAYAFRAYSHAEGKAAACGEASHAEGDAESTSIVPYSHAEGCGRAGVEGYQILSYQAETDESTGKTTGSYTLTSVKHLLVGMKVSSITIISGTNIEENYTYGTTYNSACEFGKITELDEDTNTIKTDTYHDPKIESSSAKGYLYSADYLQLDEQPKSIGVSGRYSHAEGSSQAIGNSSHAEGMDTIAYGVASHSEGFQTKAMSDHSHAEGDGTQAKGMNSHAEGDGTQAKGMNSHAEGRNVIASGENQHVQGKYNKEDAEGRYAHIIGMGKTIKTRSNGHTVDWSGNAWYKGDIRVGGTSYDDAYELAIKIKAIPHTTVSGTVSVSITDFLNSEAVINYKIYGNSVQNGTPSAENPVEIQSVGDLITDESSEYYGKYKIILSGCAQNIPIYLNAPLRQRGNVADYIDFESQQVVRNIEVVDDTGTKTIDESFSVLSTPTSETLTLGSLTILSGSAQVTISISSTVAPSEFDLTYFQDINKVIAELKNALTQS